VPVRNLPIEKAPQDYEVRPEQHEIIEILFKFLGCQKSSIFVHVAKLRSNAKAPHKHYEISQQPYLLLITKKHKIK